MGVVDQAIQDAYREALEHLDVYEKVKDRIPEPGPSMAWVHAMVLERQSYWPREMRILRTNLRNAIAERESNHP